MHLDLLRYALGLLSGVVVGLSLGLTRRSRECADPPRPARSYPVPFARGGITGVAARLVGAKLGEYWGHQIVVENRPGGNGLIAMTAVVGSPDDYTLVMASGGDISPNPGLLEQMPYDVERDLVPITGVSDAPIVPMANSSSPYKSVADVIATSKAEVNIGTLGIGSITHLVLEWLASSTGTKFQNVPFKGGGSAVRALISGVVPFG